MKGDFQGQIDAIDAKLEGGSKVVTLGDSVDYGTGTTNAGVYSMYARMKSAFPDTDARTLAIGGCVIQQQAALFGAAPVAVAAASGEVPASGAMPLSTVSPQFMHVSGGGSISSVTGHLAGVAGTMTQSGGAYTFTRTTDGDAVPLTTVNSFFVADTGQYDLRNRIVIIGGGINNSEAQQSDGTVVEVMQQIVDHIAPLTKKFLVLTVLNSTSETVGTSGYDVIMECNRQIKARWPNNYYDRRQQLVDAFDPNDPTDVAANANDTPPPSKMSDPIHPNNDGHGVMYDGLAEKMILKGYL